MVPFGPLLPHCCLASHPSGYKHYSSLPRENTIHLSPLVLPGLQPCSPLIPTTQLHHLDLPPGKVLHVQAFSPSWNIIQPLSWKGKKKQLSLFFISTDLVLSVAPGFFSESSTSFSSFHLSLRSLLPHTLALMLFSLLMVAPCPVMDSQLPPFICSQVVNSCRRCLSDCPVQKRFFFENWPNCQHKPWMAT